MPRQPRDEPRDSAAPSDTPQGNSQPGMNARDYAPDGQHDDLKADVARRRAGLVELRRRFHQQPELSFEEHATAAAITDHLRQTGLEVREGLGGTGVVGLLRGTKPANGQAGADEHVLLVRADIDALPVQEISDAPYRSQVPGVMHACGHDGHIAIALTLAELLAARRDQFHGAVKFAFQPAEERIGGADLMIADGVLDAPTVDAVIGLHLWAPVPVGTISVQAGAVFASADEVFLRVRGHGGHGAMPHLAVDPIVAAAQIVVALQTLVSREISPFHPAVVTFGAIHGGEVFNVIADTVELQGTLRVYEASDRELLRRRIGEIARAVAQGMRAEVDYEIRRGCAACVNDSEMAALTRRAAEATVGAANVPGGDQRQAASDDMASFLAARPGCYFFVGASNPARGIVAPHHSARFDIDEDALPIGLETLARATLEYLG
ncbi:MAG TPA: amidohydrolase [Ktedonobacterales bacterium]|nr:amidohydrolase [Ktedonobacterales bacterium]